MTASPPPALVAGRSGTVHDINAARSRRSRRWRWELWLTAAAVLALGVGGTVFGLTDHSQHHRPPVAIQPAPAPLHARSCTVPLPASWRTQLDKGIVGSSASSGARAGLRTLGVDIAGDTLAVDTTTAPQSIVVVGADRTVHRIWQPRKGTDVHQEFLPVGAPAVVTGRWVVFALRQASGADVPPSGFYAANTRTGVVRMLTPASLARTRYELATPIAVEGTVYFSATSSDNGLGVGPGYIYAYDLASGRRRILDHGDVGRVWSAGGGVYWRHSTRTVTYLPGSLPAGYPANGTSMITDGTGQAWIRDVGRHDTEIEMRIGTSQPVTVLGPFTVDNYPQIMALSGPYLLFSGDAGLAALDTRSGALTRVGAPTDYAASGGGHTLAITTGADTTRLTLIDLSRLPALHC
jgi:hypothetical protein